MEIIIREAKKSQRKSLYCESSVHNLDIIKTQFNIIIKIFESSGKDQSRLQLFHG